MGGEHGVVLAGRFDDVTESVGRHGRVAVVQLEFGVPEAKLGVDPLTRLDSVKEELRRTAESLGEKAGDDGRRRSLPGFDERDVAVGQIGPSELGLGHAPAQSQRSDAVAYGSLTRHLFSQGGGLVNGPAMMARSCRIG